MKPIKSPEEILDEYNSEGLLTTYEVIEAMKAYAAQFELSNEEIRCQILKDDPVNDLDDEWDYGFRKGKLIGAKWYREQLKRMRNEKYR